MFNILDSKIPAGDVVLKILDETGNEAPLNTEEYKIHFVNSPTAFNRTADREDHVFMTAGNTGPMKWTAASTSENRWFLLFEAQNERVIDEDKEYNFDFKIDQTLTDAPIFKDNNDVIFKLKITIKNDDVFTCPEDGAGVQLVEVNAADGSKDCVCPESLIHPGERQELGEDNICRERFRQACTSFENLGGNMSDIRVTTSELDHTVNGINVKKCKYQFKVSSESSYTCELEGDLVEAPFEIESTITVERPQHEQEVTQEELRGIANTEIGKINSFIRTLKGEGTTMRRITLEEAPDAFDSNFRPRDFGYRFIAISRARGLIDGHDLSIGGARGNASEFRTLAEFRQSNSCNPCLDDVTTDDVTLTSKITQRNDGTFDFECVCPEGTDLVNLPPHVLNESVINVNTGQRIARGSTFCNFAMEPRFETKLLLFGFANPSFDYLNRAEHDIGTVTGLPWMISRDVSPKIWTRSDFDEIVATTGMPNNPANSARFWNVIFNAHMWHADSDFDESVRKTDASELTKEMESYIECSHKRKESDNRSRVLYSNRLPGKKLMLIEGVDPNSGRLVRNARTEKHYIPQCAAYTTNGQMNRYYDFHETDWRNAPMDSPQPGSPRPLTKDWSTDPNECNGHTTQARRFSPMILQFATDNQGASVTNLQYHTRAPEEDPQIGEIIAQGTHSLQRTQTPMFTADDFGGQNIFPSHKTAWGLIFDIYNAFGRQTRSYYWTPFGMSSMLNSLTDGDHQNQQGHERHDPSPFLNHMLHRMRPERLDSRIHHFKDIPIWQSRNNNTNIWHALNNTTNLQTMINRFINLPTS